MWTEKRAGVRRRQRTQSRAGSCGLQEGPLLWIWPVLKGISEFCSQVRAPGEKMGQINKQNAKPNETKGGGKLEKLKWQLQWAWREGSVG